MIQKQNEPKSDTALDPRLSSLDSPMDVTQTETEITIVQEDRRWRVRGLDKQFSYDRLKVNLMVSRRDLTHVNTFDLYASRMRKSFIKEAAAELYLDEVIVKKDLGRVLLKLEELQDQQIRETLPSQEPQVPAMTDEEQVAALDLLKDPALLDRILADYDRCAQVASLGSDPVYCFQAVLALAHRGQDGHETCGTKPQSAAGVGSARRLGSLVHGPQRSIDTGGVVVQRKCARTI